MITAREIKDKYLHFFEEKGHVVIPSASLTPQNDSTTLFISAGMQPLVPYLLGEPHPLGKRLVDVQKVLRTDDIDSVGDTFHHTFFEMLGNWSLGDYFKKESINWSYEFLTKELNIDPKKLSVTVFAGDVDAPRDEETAEIWKSLGIIQERIYFLPKKDNWWGPAGLTGPCGPDTEIFYDTGKTPCSDVCRPGCSCGKYCEIWNNVFMEFNKTLEGKYIPLSQKNVDTGMGVERTTTVLNGLSDDYRTEIFWPLIEIIQKQTNKNYEDLSTSFMRIITDHLRAAVFLAGDGVIPGNNQQGYVMRRLLRRALRAGQQLDDQSVDKADLITQPIIEQIINYYQNDYPKLLEKKVEIIKIILDEQSKFTKTLIMGTKYFNKIATKNINGEDAFLLYESYGFPVEMTIEMAKEKGLTVDIDGYNFAKKKHQELSRTASAGTFKSGLADSSEAVTKLHTATHLLHAALRKILGSDVSQKGSNITSERLRFDFNYERSLTTEEVQKIEQTVNEIIQQNIPVTMEVMALEEAKKLGALHFFGEKYPEMVKVYSVGEFSRELCSGPHVQLTGVLGSFKIIKQEKIGANLLRIYAKIN